MNIKNQMIKIFSSSKKCFLSNLLTYFKLLKKGIDIQYPIRISSRTNLKVGKNVKIRRGCRFEGNIILEDNVYLGENVFITGNVKIQKGTYLVGDSELVGNIEIGRYCAIARNVAFHGFYHFTNRASIQKQEGYVSKGTIKIGHDVWIGTKVIVLSGVKIGHGAVIGAGAVVTKDVEPYSIVVGVPAKHKKWRFPKKIREQLLEVEWWNWSDEKIKNNEKFFRADLTKINDIKKLIKE